MKPNTWHHVFQLYEEAGSFKELICMHVCQKLNTDILCNCFIIEMIISAIQMKGKVCAKSAWLSFGSLERLPVEGGSLGSSSTYISKPW